MIKLNLNENFICRIWEEQSFYSNLLTSEGDTVEIINYGTRNYNSGPDYKNARIKISGIIYSGSIEVHKSSIDWYQHNHKGDDKYNEVILHVVFYDDDSSSLKSPVVKKSRSIPTVILSKFLTRSIRAIWKEIINNPSPEFRLPCYGKNKNVVNSLKLEWIKSLGKLRLDFKTNRLKERLDELTDDLSKKIHWDQVLFEYIAEALGYSKNKEQFLRLSRKINFNKLLESNLTQIQIDSLFFGISGFLKELRYKDAYLDELKFRWKELKEIFNTEVLDKSEWNFFRLRPANFPTVRIAYASGLLYEILNNNFFKNIIKTFEESSDLFNDIENIFSDVRVSEYWTQHYIFGKESKSRVPAIGKERIKDINVNVLLPLVLLYSVIFEKESLKKRVEYFYKKEKQKSKGNEVTRVMGKQLEVKVNSLSDEQGLIQLHNNYCVKGKCDLCEIGKEIFKNETVHEPLKIILY